jgi:CRP-like cAMP-binding protein
LLFLVSGQALLRRAEPNGIVVTLARCEPGAVIGLEAVVRAADHPSTAAMTTAGVVVAVPASVVLGALAAGDLGLALRTQPR